MARPEKPTKQRHSIYTLATELNLNPGTVSRALRNRPEVGEETRLLVQQKAEKLGFKMRRFSPRAINICALVQSVPGQQSIFSAYVDAILDGMWRYCMQNELELSLFSSPPDKLDTDFLVRQLANRGAHGAVVINATDESRFFRLFKKEKFPFCAVMSAPEEADPWLVKVDDHGLAKKAVNYLISLGHRRIAILSGHLRFENGRRRLAGYKDALRGAGIPFTQDLVRFSENMAQSCEDDFKFGAVGSAELLRLPDPPTAILTMSDESAVGTLQTLHQQGIAAPRDMSVICFDDTRLAEFTSPRLTVVNIPNSQIGFEAASIVHRRILNKEFSLSEQVRLSVGGDLLVRESCAPCRSLKKR